MLRNVALTILILVFTSLTTEVKAEAETFTYYPPGHFIKGSAAFGSSTGLLDYEDNAPDILFPIKKTPAYANSQVYSPGGTHYAGTDGINGWADKRNYHYPWRDNFCEKREDKNHSAGLCPSGWAHQGQDIRPATRDAGVYEVVAVDHLFVKWANTGDLALRTADNKTTFNYLHMLPPTHIVGGVKKEVKFFVGQEITRGQTVGFVAQVAKDPTPVHLHFGILQKKFGKDGKPIEDNDHYTFVHPYWSLILAYQRLIGQTGILLDPPEICTHDTTRCAELVEAGEKLVYTHAALITCSGDSTYETLSWCPGTTCSNSTTCSGGNPPPADMAMSLSSDLAMSFPPDMSFPLDLSVPPPQDLSVSPPPDLSIPGPTCFGSPMPTVAWVSKAPLAGHRPTDSDAVVFNGQLHVFGATTAGTHQVYDPSANTWATKSKVPGTPLAAISVAAALGNLYAFVPPLPSRTMLYVPGTDTWTNVGTFAGLVTNAPVPTAVLGNAVYVLDGASFSAFDTFSGSWTPLADRTLGKPDSLVAGVGTVLALGSPADSSVLTSYDLVTSTWKPRASIPLPVNTSTVVVIGDVLWRFGGFKPTGVMTGVATDDISLYSQPLNTWCQISSKLPQPSAHPFVREIAGKLYFLDDTGGLSQGVIR